MSGQKRTPIEILRDDFEVMRNRVCDLTTQRQNLSDELARARAEHGNRLQSIQQQMEQRFSSQNEVLQELESNLKSTAQQHRQQLENQREQFLKELANLDQNTDNKIESLKKWTQENLDRQRTEYLRLSIEHQKQTNQLKMQIEQMNRREENREALATQYIHDLELLIASTDKNLPHQKFAPGKLDRIRRQLDAARQRLREDMSPAAVAGVQQALFDLMDLEEEVMSLELEFELAFITAHESVDSLFKAVRRNRLVSVEEDAPLQEVNYWTSGLFEILEQRIGTLKARLDKEKSTLSLSEVKKIIDEIGDLSSQQEELINEAVERIISSQLRAEMGDTVVETLQQQGFKITSQDESGYIEEDQRQAYVVNMRNLSGTRVVSVITPDERTYQNTISINTYDNQLYNEEVLQLRSDEILQALRNANLKTGQTECSETADDKYYDTQKILKKKPVNANKTANQSESPGLNTERL